MLKVGDRLFTGVTVQDQRLCDAYNELTARINKLRDTNAPIPDTLLDARHNIFNRLTMLR
jgi:hypothetical protein